VPARSYPVATYWRATCLGQEQSRPLQNLRNSQMSVGSFLRKYCVRFRGDSPYVQPREILRIVICPTASIDPIRMSKGSLGEQFSAGNGWGGWKKQGTTCSFRFRRQLLLKVSAGPSLAAWQRPTVGTNVLPFSEAEPNIIGNRHRLVERVAHIGHLDFSCTGRGIAPRVTGEIEVRYGSPHNRQ